MNQTIRRLLMSGIFMSVITIVCGQDMKNFHLYKPEENAEKEISRAVKEAHNSNKHVFIQVGGNWCVWCARFNDFVTKDQKIDSLIRADYVVYHMNYSKENYNKELLSRFQFPQRFGFPVFIILDGSGKQIHTQNSAYLEEDKGYSREKVIEFFQHWSPKALDASAYKNF
ncbi:MAG TPA: thioredoxin family protein [Flavitalea sp.]|nr:thioredoxin family protein [Flavitalea sp.]